MLSSRPGQWSMTALTSHGCRVMEGDFTFDWTGGGMLLEQPLVRLRVWRRLGHPRQQGPEAHDADPQLIPQWFLGHAHGRGKVSTGALVSAQGTFTPVWFDRIYSPGNLWTSPPAITCHQLKFLSRPRLLTAVAHIHILCSQPGPFILSCHLLCS